MEYALDLPPAYRIGVFIIFLMIVSDIGTYKKYLTIPIHFEIINRFQNGLRVVHVLRELRLQSHLLDELHYHRVRQCAIV